MSQRGHIKNDLPNTLQGKVRHQNPPAQFARPARIKMRLKGRLER